MAIAVFAGGYCPLSIEHQTDSFKEYQQAEPEGEVAQVVEVVAELVGGIP